MISASVVVSASPASAMSLKTRSRSVTMPASRLPSITMTEATRRSRISRAASRAVVSGFRKLSD